MARLRQRSQLNAVDTINVTPLLDLTMLLLIVFMVAAPLMEYTLDVSPPSMNNDKITDDKNACVVGLNKHGEYTFRKKVVGEAELKSELALLFSSNPKSNVMVRADGNQQYSKVIDLMRFVRDSGFTTVSLVTQAE
jgi:biopolymer transport protein ExbD